MYKFEDYVAVGPVVSADDNIAPPSLENAEDINKHPA
jgi:hypothetical protein